MTEQTEPTEQTEATPRRTTQAERDRAMAVNSVDDSTRVHGDQDETGLVMTATGELRHVDESGQPVDPDADAEETGRSDADRS